MTYSLVRNISNSYATRLLDEASRPLRWWGQCHLVETATECSFGGRSYPRPVKSMHMKADENFVFYISEVKVRLR